MKKRQENPLTTVRALRIKREWTQRRIADELEISQAAYSWLERGRPGVDISKHLEALSLIFEIEIDEILMPYEQFVRERRSVVVEQVEPGQDLTAMHKQEPVEQELVQV